MPHLPHLQPARLWKSDLPDMALGFAPRRSAIKRDARAGQIEAIVGAEADSGAVRQAVTPGGDRLADFAERRELPRILLALLVGRGEVAEQGFDGQAVERATGRFLGAKPEAVHARVDHHVARPPLPRFTPPRDLRDAVQHLARGKRARSEIGRATV